MVKQHLYDAFTGISISKKNAIVQFFKNNLETIPYLDQTALLKAIEYSTKEIPSFGGFVLTAEENQEIIAALIVNKTGLKSILPEYLAVFQATKRVAKNKLITRKLEEKAISLAKGDISLVIKNECSGKILRLEEMITEAKFRPIQAKAESQVKASA